MNERALEQAYADCLRLTRSHYENFPVASWLLPRALRKPVAVIYAFARTADDLADEGDLTPEARLTALDALGVMLDGIASGAPQTTALGVALADVIQRHALPIELFRDLLGAFRQDVTQKRYAHFGELMDYCRRSANPIGRLLLHLLNHTDAHDLACSDAICSALQLINFYQDLAQDSAENGRIYIPQEEMQRFGVDEAHFRARRTDLGMQRLMQHQYDRAFKLLRAGAPLAKRLPGRFGFELRLTVLGGRRILEYLDRNRANVFARPRLTRADWLKIVWQALRGS
ncbi:MAG: squalene synthase HpnC [Gammaproteobacteria bacterium]|nr:squalene synthase HpnC [Gammaproteobacteria bacterium]